MSMSEFERRRLPDPENHSSSLSLGDEFPDDFSDEDMAFAQELDAFFAVDKEMMPPYFVQTLLASEDPRFQVVEDGFEKKTCARVFRLLKLRRRISVVPHSPVQKVASFLPTRRMLISLFTLCMLIVAMTVVGTGNAFASGLTFLLSGEHGGVLLLDSYPRDLTSTTAAHSEPAGPLADVQSSQQMDLWDVRQKLHFSIYWPDPRSIPANYVVDKIYLDNSQEIQGLADGPVMELEYAYTSPGVIPSGRGTITIIEFKPMGKVMLAVQRDSAHQLEISPNEDGEAVYVDGQWKKKIGDSSSYQWAYGQCSQLIYERNGVVFWVVGDQRDGVDGKVLSTIATSLAPLDIDYYRHMGHILGQVLEGKESSGLFAGDVVYIDNPDNPDGPTLKVVGVTQSDSSYANGTTRMA